AARARRGEAEAQHGLLRRLDPEEARLVDDRLDLASLAERVTDPGQPGGLPPRDGRDAERAAGLLVRRREEDDVARARRSLRERQERLELRDAERLVVERSARGEARPLVLRGERRAAPAARIRGDDVDVVMEEEPTAVARAGEARVEARTAGRRLVD